MLIDIQCTRNNGVWIVGTTDEMPGFGACQEVWGCVSWNPKEDPLAGEGGCCLGGMWSPAERGPSW